ncbi:FAD-dependent oxidoreductase [Spirochaeta cellobiosiphila]|uniref:FAD-dependent oxidoreductase n=1 Tax=Spirochaeta cellobiosiphila TaxID=504483 RepID=UPI0003F5FBD6|nr:FAD-dependent oxidoreductase [Spirochaeta cellobiosiphila]
MKFLGLFKKTAILVLALLSISLLLNSCGKKNAVQFEPGTYQAQGEGREGKVDFDVTFSNDKITDINVVSQSETKVIGQKALETMKKRILKAQSVDVDTVSGATMSSQAMLEAVSSAIKQAGANPDDMVVGVDKGETKNINYSADIIVIGAGASGSSAAISAADLGAKVILVEKTSTIGGASNLSWAGKFYNSSVALQKGLKVDEEATIKDWIQNNHWRVNAAAIRQYVTKSKDTYTWLNSKGYKLGFVNFAGEQLHPLPPYDQREGLLRGILHDTVEAKGGLILTNTTAKELITDSEGKVIGAVATDEEGNRIELKASAVIIATGGYAANKEMVKEAFGFEGINGGLGQNVGEGLKMAWAVGAKVPDNFGGQMLHQTLAPATKALKKEFESFKASYPVMLTYLPNFMNVGPDGARFRDEGATLVAVAAANTSAFNGPYHMVIVSQSQLKALESKGMRGIHAPKLPGMPPEFYSDFRDKYKLDTPWTDVQTVFDKMVANGDGYKGNTIEELAFNAGIDKETFLNSYSKYQKAISDGVDREFGKDSRYLEPMGNEGPYYAIVAQINNLGSVGGLLVNTEFKVLNDKRIPIKGLYAVGLESEGVLFNDTYVGNGVGIAYSFTSGRLGGEYCAKEVLDLE